MIMGMLEPSDGYMELFGQDMLLERATLNGTIGICPQDNVLYDLLTV